MENPRGTVVALQTDAAGRRAVVDVDALTACPRCAQGRGCGAGIFSAQTGNHTIEAVVRPDLEICEGDVVSIGLEPGNVLQAALIVYGLPLLGAATGATMAYLFALGDLVAALAALAGLVAGGFAGRWRLDRQACVMQFTPTVSARIDLPERGPE